MTTLKAIGEFGLIDRIERIMADRSARKAGLMVGIGDDAAVVRSSGSHWQAVTVDTLEETVHFDLAYTDFRSLGWKALAVNLSDLAAMGARPQWAVIALALPERLSVQDVLLCHRGLRQCARIFDTRIIGGNVARSSAGLSLTVTVLGEVAPGRVWRRSGAKPGDVIAVTGSLGLSRAGLQAFRHGLSGRGLRAAKMRHVRPTPRVAAAQRLQRARVRVHACIDISDGLASDLLHVTRASGVGARIDCARLPVHPAARRVAAQLNEETAEYVWNGGEDYELLMTLSKNEFTKARRTLRGGLTAIGTITRGRAVVAVQSDGTTARVTATGYHHF